MCQDDRQCRHRETDSCIDFTLGEAGVRIQENRVKGSPSVGAGNKWSQIDVILGGGRWRQEMT